MIYALKTLTTLWFLCFWMLRLPVSRTFPVSKVSDKGYPIHSLLASEFGHVFVFGYVVSYMLVSMGIFNVILGVYVEITMKALIFSCPDRSNVNKDLS